MDLKNRLCRRAGCGRHAYYASAGDAAGGATHCAQHCAADAVDTRGTRCRRAGCGRKV